MSKRLPWLRLYTRMVDDDKLKLLAFEDRWHFVALLCLKGEGLLDKADTPSLLMRKVAVKLGLDVRSLEEVARRLTEVGLIEQETLQPVKWAVLQMQSDVDATAAVRKQRQRERQKAAKAAPGNDVTHGHEEGTDASRVTGTNFTRTDTDTDTDKEEETFKEQVPVGPRHSETSPPAQPAKPEPDAKPSTTGTRLPSDWMLPKSWGTWAIEERPEMTAEEVRRQAAMFADHFHAAAGKDGRKVDWKATWRNWIRRANLPRAGRPAAGAGVPLNKQEALEQRNRNVGAAWAAQGQGGSHAAA
ncbi:hypothetical protein [Delftia tsuruhatensis]|uniref:hypothetical protein n=1 Tax=Delftia tsuruhatensis TaxID=180282 RepID=UPI0012A9AC58|nr:hypothetical protein [Delftia tsuruhatensis]QFS64807.1 hypothetical protein GCS91_11040 [Delftia tsuruhatensis]